MNPTDKARDAEAMDAAFYKAKLEHAQSSLFSIGFVPAELWAIAWDAAIEHLKSQAPQSTATFPEAEFELEDLVHEAYEFQHGRIYPAGSPWLSWLTRAKAILGKRGQESKP